MFENYRISIVDQGLFRLSIGIYYRIIYYHVAKAYLCGLFVRLPISSMFYPIRSCILIRIIFLCFFITIFLLLHSFLSSVRVSRCDNLAKIRENLSSTFIYHIYIYMYLASKRHRLCAQEKRSF